MSDDATAISNLLYIYGEKIDAGDWESAAALFEHAEMTVGGNVLRGSTQVLRLWREHLKLHDDGTPRTKHIVSNPIIEILSSGDRAKVRSCYTVFQATDSLPLQVIAAGRYLDEFEKIDGDWRFSKRDHPPIDLIGDLREHLLSSEAPGLRQNRG